MSDRQTDRWTESDENCGGELASKHFSGLRPRLKVKNKT